MPDPAALDAAFTADPAGALAAAGYRGHWIVDRAAAILAGTWTDADETALRQRLAAQQAEPATSHTGPVELRAALTAWLARAEAREVPDA